MLKVTFDRPIFLHLGVPPNTEINKQERLEKKIELLIFKLLTSLYHRPTFEKQLDFLINIFIGNHSFASANLYSSKNIRDWLNYESSKKKH